jgi:hypothetical protein
MIVGIVGALVGAATVVPPLFGTIFARAHDVPGTVHLELGPGRYTIFERTGTSRQYGPISTSRSRAPSVTAAQVHVTDSSGSPVPVEPACACETVERNGRTFWSVLEFRTPRRDDYTLSFRTAGGQVLVVRSLGDILGARVPWLVTGGIGGVVVLLGGVMLVVGTIRRGQQQRDPFATASNAGTPPAGWFADPTGAGRLRYWDGSRWTEHTS